MVAEYCDGGEGHESDGAKGGSRGDHLGVTNTPICECLSCLAQRLTLHHSLLKDV